MKTTTGLSLLASLVISGVGCSAGDQAATVGVTPSGGGGGGGGGATSGAGNNGGGGGSLGGFGNVSSQSGGSQSSVHVEQNDVVVTIITLQCGGECADVVAVARGGVPPYSYKWEDGTTTAERHLCPTVSTAFSVTATDAGIPTGEFRRDPKSTSTAVTANVLTCPDGGAPPPPDGGKPPPNTGVCFTNGTFTGTPALNILGNFDANPWTGCASTPDVFDRNLTGTTYGASSALAPTDGNTYLHLNSSIPSESASQKLCTPLVAGHKYSIKLDLYSPVGSTVQPVPAAKLNVFGSAVACGTEELLWRSPTPTAAWQNHCFTFTPSRDLAYMMLEAYFEGSEGTLFVDNIVTVPSCP